MKMNSNEHLRHSLKTGKLGDLNLRIKGISMYFFNAIIKYNKK